MSINQLKQKFKNIKILYVEDDDTLRQEISEFLKRYVDSLIAVSCAEDALKIYKKDLPDILLLDVNLPGMNGLTLAKKIREENRDVRIIISTAYTDKDFLLEAVELELTRYLVKPMVGKDLLSAIEKAVDESLAHGDTTESIYIPLQHAYRYDTARKVLMHKDRDVLLRRKEKVLLEYFLAHVEEIISYEILEYHIWEGETMSRDAIRAQIRNLRKKTYPDIVKNIPAIGYKLTLKKTL